MTQCNPCPVMKPLPRCMAALTMGDTAHNSTAMYVYIMNHTTNVLTRIPQTTSIGGSLRPVLTDYPQIEGHDYEIWATLAAAGTGIDDRETITLDTVEYTCFSISFVNLYDEDGELVTGENQTLEAA